MNKQLTHNSMEQKPSCKATTSFLIKDFPLCYGNWKLFTAFKRSRHHFVSKPNKSSQASAILCLLKFI